MIQRILLFCFCGSVFLLTSCVHGPVKKTIEQNAASMSGSVVDEALLLEGGDLALVPFKAGSKAEANDELDRLSMMVLKGIKESLDENDQNISLHVVNETEAKPQIVLEGYFEEYSKTNRVSRMMMHPNKSTLTLEGDLWLVSTGKRLLTFSIKKKFNPKKEKSMDIAYAMGKEIGRFIVSKSKSKGNK